MTYAKAEVLDVAQLLLGSLDKSSVTLPEKGSRRKGGRRERAAEGGGRDGRRPHEPEAKPEPKADAGTATESKPVTGLGIAGGAKRPGAKKCHAGRAGRAEACGALPNRPQRPPRASASRRAPSVPAPRRPVRRASRSSEAPAPAEPAKAEPEVKGLGIAAGAKRPGAKNNGAPAPPPASPHRPPQSRSPTAAEPAPTAAEPRSRAWASHRVHAGPAPRRRLPQPAAKPAAPQPEPETDGESAAAPEPSSEGNGEQPERQPPVKGLGIAKGARPPGKR